MSNELQILNQNSIVTAFATKGGINEIFESVAAEVRKEVPDVTTKKGRDAIGSLAMKVSKSKKIIEDAGKALVAEQKAQIKLIDDDRISVVKMFDALRDEVLAPRDAWENAEKDRVAKHEEFVNQINSYEQICINSDYTSSQVDGAIKRLESVVIDESLQEFQDKAKLAKYEQLDKLKLLKSDLEENEKQQAEIEKQRIAEQERLQREHEERIAKQAAENARIEAERKAQDELAKVEREKQEAIEREAKLKLEAEQAIIREQKAKEAAEKAAKQAEIDKQNAIEAERLRIQQQQEAEAAHAAKLEAQRKANIEHMRQINNDILSSIIKTGITEDQAKDIIKLIAKNEVPHVSIKY